MTFPTLIWPSMPNISSTTDMAAAQREETSKRNKRWMLPPRITLPVVILAMTATFASPAFAENELLAPKITTPASLDRTTFSDVADEVRTAMAPPVTMPSTDGMPELRRMKRNGKDGDSDSSTDGSETTCTESSTTSTTMTRLSQRSTSTVDTSSSPLPSPFDNPVPNAFQIPGGGTSCPKFMAGLLSDPTFKSCYPISMLMQTSTSFFNAEKQLVSIVKVLDATCAADVTKCTSFLNKAAQNLTADANCKAEFEQNQTQVLLAWRGLQAYNVLYSATCLQDPSSGSYCFANAVTNLSTPSDTYLYFMPYGLALPGASTPTCNWCTQKTMSIYHSASANRRQLVASRYEDAARQVNTLCGPNFVNSTLPAAENGAFAVTVPSSFSIVFNVLLALFLFSCFL